MPSPDENCPPPGSFRELAQVAWPLALSAGSLSLLQVTDRVFLTWYSTDALAAAMPAGMLFWTVISLLLGTVMYVNTFVAQYDGAGNKDRLVASVWQGVYLALAGGASMLVVLPFSDAIFVLIGHEPRVRALESQYFSILGLGTVPYALSMAMSCFYSGRGHSSTVMYVNFASIGVNAGLDYLLIFGYGPFPRLGISGAALATVISQVTAAATYAALIYRTRQSGGYRIFENARYDRDLMRRLVRYGLPTGLLFLADIACFSLFVFLVGRIGTRELAATNLAFNLNSLAFIPMFGIGTAVMTLVGRRIGEGRPELAVRTAWLAFGVVGAYMIGFALVYLCLPDVIMYPFAAFSDPAEFAPIRETVISLLRFVALYSFFDGMVIVFGSAVRGAGDTRFSLVFTFVCAWLLLVLPTFAATWAGSARLTISWWACTTYVMTLGIGYMIRFRQGRWKSMRVIEHPTGDSSDGTDWLHGDEAFDDPDPLAATVFLPDADSLLTTSSQRDTDKRPASYEKKQPGCSKQPGC